jgi:hypothetical protein
MRSTNLYTITKDTAREIQAHIKRNLNEIDNIQSFLLANKLFSNEELVIKKLDDLIIKSSQNLTGQEWVDLLNTKSILRLRNLSLLESCAFNLIEKTRKNQFNIDLPSIQKCLLSNGMLNFHDEEFYKFLTDSLNKLLIKNSNKEWLDKMQNEISSTISSLGILQLRDTSLVDTICGALNKVDPVRFQKLIINFVISCAALYYKPKVNNSYAEFDGLVSKLKESNFNTVNVADKIKLLDFVWSLSVLNVARQDLISIVLNDLFFKSILNGNLLFYHKIYD